MIEIFNFDFMKNALLAILLVSPIFAVLGTMVVSNRMAFFTDVIGHSALAGIAIGLLLGFADPLLPMLVFAVLLSIGINIFKSKTNASMDTVIGVFFAFVVALGIVILSRNGGFAKYTNYLIGDVLTITANQIHILLVLLLSVLVYWVFTANALVLMSINESLAKSRRLNVFWIKTIFTAVIAVVVILSVKILGILIINSLLILPAAAARNISRSFMAYTIWSILISLVSGIVGLICSFYWGSAAGATIVLFAAFFYLVCVVVGKKGRVI